ncbi:MAG: GNAT family N-acetyltransferase [Candidatus Yonathbacteria bacterium]|nr:GNAT family N-acetyltransferase [Candidatus Yonathbacteria bacterium]
MIHTNEKMKELSLSFKKATPEDVDAFMTLDRIAVKEGTYSGLADRNEALKEIGDTEVYLIYKEGTLVGSAEFQIQGPDVAELAGLVVHPDFRGQGIGREATLFRLEKLKGIKRLYVVTHPENFKTIGLYESLGFTIEKHMENYRGDGKPRVMLVRENKFNIQ